VADPLAFSGYQPAGTLTHERIRNREARVTGTVGNRAHGKTVAVKLPKHPVTVWRGRLDVALDALAVAEQDPGSPLRRTGPMETTNVLLPTGDRLQIPTGAETLRLKGYLMMARNAVRDFTEFSDLVASMDTRTAADVLSGMDRYYCGPPARPHWVATQLVRRLADPRPAPGTGDAADAEQWAKVRQRCLAVAVAMLEEAR
jgi:RND superfamily putative drug exporter